MQALALNEPRRRSYLQALGLDLLRARSVLPGAAASVEWDQPEPVAASLSIEKAAALPTAAIAAREALRDVQPGIAVRATEPALVASKGIELPSAPAHNHTPASAPTSQPNKPLSARFSLLLVPINATHIALVDLDNQPALEGSEARLWGAICSAQLWQHQAPDMPAQFHWPIPGLASTQAVAQEALAGWLQTQHTEHMSCIVFGENLSAVAPRGHQCFPSLQALLAEPLRKRELMLKLHGPI